MRQETEMETEDRDRDRGRTVSRTEGKQEKKTEDEDREQNSDCILITDERELVVQADFMDGKEWCSCSLGDLRTCAIHYAQFTDHCADHLLPSPVSFSLSPSPISVSYLSCLYLLSPTSLSPNVSISTVSVSSIYAPVSYLCPALLFPKFLFWKMGGTTEAPYLIWINKIAEVPQSEWDAGSLPFFRVLMVKQSGNLWQLPLRRVGCQII